MRTTLARPGTTAVTASGLTKAYGSGAHRTLALDGVTADFRPGQFTALMGPPGAGKSTLLRCLAGLAEPTAGSAAVGGLRATDPLASGRVGLLVRDGRLPLTGTVRAHLTAPHGPALRPVEPDCLAPVVAGLGLADLLDRPLARLGAVQRRLVACARVLVGGPAVLLADDPTGGLDARAGAGLLGHLHDTVRRPGRTVLLVTGDPVAASFADRVLFLAAGRLVDELALPTPDTVAARLRRAGLPAARPV
ncbi:ATP-binding cassette domain-containing protein [Kitasatospora sp. NPDC058965]|uniref:ATP-binding cassette domain-containing protein n=1 Tax=Kitasatospora sp. NPDC058965 TaxID=3346682 RepID=UPI0036C1DF22